MIRLIVSDIDGTLTEDGGSRYANVMGLPVSRLYQELKELNGI